MAPVCGGRLTYIFVRLCNSVTIISALINNIIECALIFHTVILWDFLIVRLINIYMTFNISVHVSLKILKSIDLRIMRKRNAWWIDKIQVWKDRLFYHSVSYHANISSFIWRDVFVFYSAVTPYIVRSLTCRNWCSSRKRSSVKRQIVVW